jgi:hypothetical protein
MEDDESSTTSRFTATVNAQHVRSTTLASNARRTEMEDDESSTTSRFTATVNAQHVRSTTLASLQHWCLMYITAKRIKTAANFCNAGPCIDFLVCCSSCRLLV